MFINLVIVFKFTAYINSLCFFCKSSLSSLMIAFRRFLTWIAPSNADFRFSLILLTKANSVDGRTTSAACLHH